MSCTMKRGCDVVPWRKLFVRSLVKWPYDGPVRGRMSREPFRCPHADARHECFICGKCLTCCRETWGVTFGLRCFETWRVRPWLIGLLLVAALFLLTGCEGITYPSRLRCCAWSVTVNANGDSIGSGIINGPCDRGNAMGLRNPVREWRADDCRVTG